MNILVTGSKGFVGKNLCEALKNIRGGKDRTRPDIQINDIGTPYILQKSVLVKRYFRLNVVFSLSLHWI